MSTIPTVPAQETIICEDGKIEPGDALGEALGFTRDRFDGWLWKEGDRILISMIISRQPGRGHLSELLEAIEMRGLRAAVPTPFAAMQAIITAKGYEPHYETGDYGMVEVWEKPRAVIVNTPALCSRCSSPIDASEVATRTYAGTGDTCRGCFGRDEKRQCEVEGLERV
jgi:hypothetical protein